MNECEHGVPDWMGGCKECEEEDESISALSDRVIKPDGKKEEETGPDRNGCNYGAQGGWCDAPDDYKCAAKVETKRGNGCLEAL